MKGFDGDIQLRLLNPNLFSKSQKWVIDSKIDNLNIQKMMMAFKDFDQDLLKSENINGEITSEFSANILLDSLNLLNFPFAFLANLDFPTFFNPFCITPSVASVPPSAVLLRSSIILSFIFVLRLAILKVSVP